MTERPIIFNDAMSLAVIEGRKTVTRWPIADMGGDEAYTFSRMAPGGGGALFTLRDGRYTTQRNHSFGAPGDKLWVREAWRATHQGFEYRCDGACYPFMLKADQMVAWRKWQAKLAGGKWAPSIHMPRWASRTVLDVLDVRVERLQDITDEGARAEGFASRVAFIETWDAIYPSMPFHANPWVWVIEFKRAT